MTRFLLVPLLLAAALSAGAQSRFRDDAIDSALRETVHSVPVASAGASIVVTSYRPQGGGPFPWIVLSHGTATTPEANRAIGRARSPQLVQQWLQRGYAVLLPVRRGYGASGGSSFADSYGSCSRPDFRRAGEGAALDLLTTAEWAKTQPDLDPKRWLLVGQSAGGFASIYAASKRPTDLVAVLAFAPGRGGSPETRPFEPCAADQMADLFAAIAPQIAVPVLWFYAENDEFFGPRVQKLWFERFKAAGGRGEHVMVAPFPERRGHGVLTAPAGVPLWTPAVSGFFRTQEIKLPF